LEQGKAFSQFISLKLQLLLQGWGSNFYDLDIKSYISIYFDRILPKLRFLAKQEIQSTSARAHRRGELAFKAWL
jgi:hypothetical protein